MPAEVLKETAKDRLNHPFLGAFIFSFTLVNWKCWFYAFYGDLTPDERITAINARLADVGSDAFVLPLLYAAGFVVAYPILTAVIASFFHVVKVMENNVKNWITFRADSTDEQVLKYISYLASNAIQSIAATADHLQYLEEQPPLPTINQIGRDMLTAVGFMRAMDGTLNRNEIRVHYLRLKKKNGEL